MSIIDKLRLDYTAIKRAETFNETSLVCDLKDVSKLENLKDEMLVALITVLIGFERNDCIDWGEVQKLIEKSSDKTWEQIKELINE